MSTSHTCSQSRQQNCSAPKRASISTARAAAQQGQKRNTCETGEVLGTIQIPDAAWYATEDDKVALFTRELGVSLDDLPRRVYATTDRRSRTTTRHFIHKLPVYLTPDRAVVHFVYLVNDDRGQGFRQFLHDHVRLLHALPAWRIVAVCPRGLRGSPACRTVFDEFAAATGRPAPPEGLASFRGLFTTRQLVERGDLRSLSVADLDRFREARTQFANAHMEALYGAWVANGDHALEPGIGGAQKTSHAAELIVHELPSTYSQFGSFPGVC